MHSEYFEGIVGDAAQVSCTLMFSMHWDDTRVPRSDALDLFDALGSIDKRLHAGDHSSFSEEEFTAGERFLAPRVGAKSDAAKRPASVT